MIESHYVSNWPLNEVCSTHTKGWEVPNVTLKPNKNGKVNLLIFSDIHFGQKAFNEELFNKHLDLVRELDAYIILAGDLFEIAIPSHIESSVFDVDYQTDDQWLTALNYFGEFKDRIIFSLSGNHDLRVWKKTGFDLAREFARNMGCFYNRHGGLISLNVKNKRNSQNYLLGAWHGFSSGVNPFMELEKRANTYDNADILALGNNHALCAKTIVKKRLVNGRDERVYMHLVRTGSYMTEPDYGRQALYPPTLDGSPIITLDSSRKNVTIDVQGELRWR